MQEKICIRCQKNKPIWKFYLRKGKHRGHCIDCHSLENKAKQNKPQKPPNEKRREYERKRHEKLKTQCPFLRLGRRYKIKPQILWSIAKKQKNKCPLTGRKLTNENVSLDHIKPKFFGGNNETENLRLVEKHANIMKGTLTDDELFEWCFAIVENLFRSMPPGMGGKEKPSPKGRQLERERGKLALHFVRADDCQAMAFIFG